MPAIRENKTAAQAPASETALKPQHAPPRRAAFDARADARGRTLPPDAHPEVCRFFGLMAGALSRRRPEGVSAVIAYTTVSWQLKPSEVKLYTFTEGGRSAEHRWSVLDGMAEAVGEAMLETDVFPVILPVLPGEWERAAERRSAAFRHVGVRGVLLYSGAAARGAEGEVGA